MLIASFCMIVMYICNHLCILFCVFQPDLTAQGVHIVAAFSERVLPDEEKDDNCETLFVPTLLALC